MALHNEVGKLGEDIAVQWVSDRGFAILSRNYRQKWGEIDIVAHLPAQAGETGGKVSFIEVKTVSYETKDDLKNSVSHETWRPEDNVHERKLKRLGRAVETWIAENKYEGKWQIDVLTVRMVPREKYALVKLIDNVILE